MTLPQRSVRHADTPKSHGGLPRDAVLSALAHKAGCWGMFVRERAGQEGPVRPNGMRYRYLAGTKGGEPEVGFDTLPPLARWVEDHSDFL